VDPNAEKKAAIKAQILLLIPTQRHFRELLADVLVSSYEGRGFRPLWDESILQAGIHRSLCAALSAHAFPDLLALDPEALVPSITDTTVEKRDLAYSVALLDAGLLVRMGPVPGEKIWKEWYRDDTPGSDDWSLESVQKDLLSACAIQPFDIPRVLETLGPKNWIYRELFRAYPGAKESILKYSGLPQIPDPSNSGSAKPGELFAAAPAVAAHLIDRGYLQMDPAIVGTLSSMTPELSAALIAFQRDYGLDPDGVFGPASWRYLNTNAADQYRSITINLHRARLIPNDMGDRYVLVNLPSAELFLFEDNDFYVDSMRIVHGKASKDTHHTPVFRDVMQEIVFGPYWNVPHSIAVKEVLPKAQEDWGYLSRNRYEIVSDFNPYNKSAHRLSPQNLELVKQGRLFLRQKPGPTNALGHIKFLFPNSFHIYMHDTPAKAFFHRTNRDYSHGCIRLAEPEKLGEWVLKPESWTVDQVKAAMHGDERKSMTVKGGINVFITYFTTFPRPIAGGKMVPAPARDVYGRDDVDSATLKAVIPWNPAGAPAAGAPATGAPAAASTTTSSAAGSTLPTSAPAAVIPAAGAPAAGVPAAGAPAAGVPAAGTPLRAVVIPGSE
jgi:murein L,D-transpeptidase YcbB/YkuD